MKKIYTRRFVIIPLLAILLMLTCSISASAVSEPQSVKEIKEETILYVDGSYDTITLTVSTPTARISKTTSGTKTITKHSVLNVTQYSFTVYGSFSYTGTSATAIRASASYKIYESSWSCTDKTVEKSGNTVTGTATFKNGLSKNYPTATITCSATGVLS